MDDFKYKNTSKVDYRELSDVDFIRNLDVLASNYYSDYIQGRAVFTGSVDSFVSRTAVDGCKATPYPLYPPRKMKFTGYYKRRGFFLFLLTLLTLIEVVYIALSFALPDLLTDNIPFLGDGTLLSAPVMALFGEGALATYVGSGDISAYLFLGGVIGYAVLSVVTLIVAFVALFSGRRKDGAYKRYRFGVLSILRLVCMAVAAAGGLTLGSSIGYGAILLLITPAVTFLCSLLSYKKTDVFVPETYLDVNGKIKEGYSPLDFLA